MEFKIISFGKFPNTSPYKELFYDYKKRISYKVNLIELKNVTNSNSKIYDENAIISKYNDASQEFIILDKQGLNISSQKLSRHIDDKIQNRYKQMIFFIGGPDGLSSNLIGSKKCFSFGNQTWPHLLVRVMLIEQIYRSLCIIKNHPYHK